MKSTVISGGGYDISEELLRLLPYKLADAVRREMRCRNEICEEIRIRKGRMSSLDLVGGRFIPLDVMISGEEMEETVSKLCGGSMYAHLETIKQGYISLRGGIRAGVSGHAAVENGKIIGVSDISGICIRLPHAVNTDVGLIVGLLKKFGFLSGVLVYSPPGVGKTTLLRRVAAEISCGADAVKTVIVDSRGELEFGLGGKNLCLDILSGYPKAAGIEIALRTMGARLIICDEIGNDDEISSICSAANGGAALLASAHASDIDGLMSKKNILELHRCGVFGAYVGIMRRGNSYAFNTTFCDELEKKIC